MTKQQVKIILDKYGIPKNEWVEVGNELMYMSLKTRGFIKFDDRYMRCKFNQVNEVVEIVQGRTINGIFRSDDNESINFKTTTYIPYSVIISATATVDKHEFGRYAQKPFHQIKEYI